MVHCCCDVRCCAPSRPVVKGESDQREQGPTDAPLSSRNAARIKPACNSGEQSKQREGEQKKEERSGNEIRSLGNDDDDGEGENKVRQAIRHTQDMTGQALT